MVIVVKGIFQSFAGSPSVQLQKTGKGGRVRMESRGVEKIKVHNRDQSVKSGKCRDLCSLISASVLGKGRQGLWERLEDIVANLLLLHPTTFFIS